MNYIKHLTAYYHRMSEDHSLNATHVSLYMALFQFWNLNRFHNPMSIARDEVMQISKIGSKSTYHKCMQELHDKKYIVYHPSTNPLKGSTVIMLDFEKPGKAIKKVQTSPKSGQVVVQLPDKYQTGTGTTAGQVVVPSINYRNNTNLSNNEKTIIKNQSGHLHPIANRNYEEPL